MNAPAKRSYRMGARAAAAERTRLAIIDAVVELFMERDPDAISLEAIAERAQVTLQTVLRKFGSKDGLFEAAAQVRRAAVLQSRQPERPGDPRAAIRALVASYETLGDLNWRMLRFEAQIPALRPVLDGARALHRGWIESSFADLLSARGALRERRVDALFTATDFYVWKLHRRDLGRSRAQVEATMLGLVEALALRFREEGES